MGHYSASQSRRVTVYDKSGKSLQMSEREFLATGKEKDLSLTKPSAAKATAAKSSGSKANEGK